MQLLLVQALRRCQTVWQIQMQCQVPGFSLAHPRHSGHLERESENEKLISVSILPLPLSAALSFRERHEPFEKGVIN